MVWCYEVESGMDCSYNKNAAYNLFKDALSLTCGLYQQRVKGGLPRYIPCALEVLKPCNTSLLCCEGLLRLRPWFSTCLECLTYPWLWLFSLEELRRTWGRECGQLLWVSSRRLGEVFWEEFWCWCMCLRVLQGLNKAQSRLGSSMNLLFLLPRVKKCQFLRSVRRSVTWSFWVFQGLKLLVWVWTTSIHWQLLVLSSHVQSGSGISELFLLFLQFEGEGLWTRFWLSRVIVFWQCQASIDCCMCTLEGPLFGFSKVVHMSRRWSCTLAWFL